MGKKKKLELISNPKQTPAQYTRPWLQADLVSPRHACRHGLWLLQAVLRHPREEVSLGLSVLTHPLPSHHVTSLFDRMRNARNHPLALLTLSVCSCCWVSGLVNHAFCFTSNSELAREKVWSRIHILPLLQAEEDRDQVRRHFADLKREKELLGTETKVYNSDRCGCSPLWIIVDGVVYVGRFC